LRILLETVLRFSALIKLIETASLPQNRQIFSIDIWAAPEVRSSDKFSLDSNPLDSPCQVGNY